jgi:hypothetical protein
MTLQFFNGTDVNHDELISKQEFLDFVRAKLTKDKDYQLKMAFRAFDHDHDRNRILDHDEIHELGIFIIHDFTPEQEQEIFKFKCFTYAQLYQLIYHEYVDPKTDPYEGHCICCSRVCSLL